METDVVQEFVTVHKKRVAWNRGLTASEEMRKKLSLAHIGQTPWNKGLKGLQVAWNKGKTNVYSKERMEQLRLARVGKIISEETKKKLSEANQNMSPEAKAIRSAKLRASRLGKKLSDAARLKVSQSRLRDKHWHWKGDPERNRYPVGWSRMLKRQIRERDNFTCQHCGKIQERVLFCVHHIDYHKENCCQNNLITLCRPCHTKTNYNCDFWFNYFTQKLNERMGIAV